MLTIQLAPPTTIELLIVNSARVSLSKSSTHLCANDRNLIRFLYQQSHWTPFGHPQLTLLYEPPRGWKPPESIGSARVLTDGLYVERGSLWYWVNNYTKYGENAPGIANQLAKHAPTLADVAGLPVYDTKLPTGVYDFELNDEWVASRVEQRAALATVTFLVKAPIPVRTQCFKHKIGFIENEVSRRYVDAPPTFFEPEIWRSRAPGVKQGSLPTPVSHHWLAKTVAKITYAVSDMAYRTHLALGVCPEQARFLLAQGMETEWYWTASLADFYRAYRLRRAPDAQREIWELFGKIDSLLARRWPLSWQKLCATK